MAAALITQSEAEQLFAAYLNISQTDAENLVGYIFGTGDRTVTGDQTVTGSVITNSVKQRTAAGLTVGIATDKLGFYGKAPIVQAVLATGAGATVDDVITALQNIGLVKQA